MDVKTLDEYINSRKDVGIKTKRGFVSGTQKYHCDIRYIIIIFSEPFFLNIFVSHNQSLAKKRRGGHMPLKQYFVFKRNLDLLIYIRT